MRLYMSRHNAEGLRRLLKSLRGKRNGTDEIFKALPALQQRAKRIADRLIITSNRTRSRKRVWKVSDLKEPL